jgi:hypothetical protein
LFRFLWIDIALARARLDLGSGKMLDRLVTIGHHDLSLAESAEDQSPFEFEAGNFESVQLHKMIQ